MQVYAAPAWLWRFETSREQELADSRGKSKRIKVVKIAREVNAADSLACVSATNILRDHMKPVICELIDNQEHVLVEVFSHLQHQQ